MEAPGDGLLALHSYLALHSVTEITALLRNYRNRRRLLGLVGGAPFVRVGGIMCSYTG